MFGIHLRMARAHDAPLSRRQRFLGFLGESIDIHDVLPGFSCLVVGWPHTLSVGSVVVARDVLGCFLYFDAIHDSSDSFSLGFLSKIDTAKVIYVVAATSLFLVC
jgi:hypothetical protein